VTRRRRPRRHLVLDNEAAQALLSTDAEHPKRAAVVTAIAAADGSCIVPAAVRAEAGWRRTDRAAADANRLVGRDDVLDSAAADRVVELLADVPGASVVDATVVVAGERVARRDDAVVELLTSDVRDISALADHSGGRFAVARL
jgi:hypothetical protein